MSRRDRWNHNTRFYPRVLAAAPRPCARALDVGCGDGLRADLPLGGFDLVASVAVIHHLDFVAGIRRMAALLRPGGRLVVVGLARNATSPTRR